MDDFIVKEQLIDRDLILSCIVLECSCEETLSEEELIDPVERWDTIVDPVLEEFESLL